MRRHSYSRVAAAIKKAGKIALCIHVFPDGDAIGSMLALARCLKKLGKQFCVFSPDELPRRYSFLPYYKAILRRPRPRSRFDLAIAIDCASSRQLGPLYESVFETAAETIEIDHHQFRRRFADLALVDQRAAAVGEIIYELLGFLDIRLDKDLAVAILVSIIVETGSFRLPTVRAKTFRICADLVSRGIDYYRIVEQSYWTRTRAEAILLGLVFSRLKFLKGGRIAYSFVTRGDLRRLGASQEDADPIADQIRTLETVKIAIFFREVAGFKWRVSLRSKGAINVGQIAEEFGGGGHADIAGCFLEKRQKQQFIRRLSKLF